MAKDLDTKIHETKDLEVGRCGFTRPSPPRQSLRNLRAGTRLDVTQIGCGKCHGESGGMPGEEPAVLDTCMTTASPHPADRSSQVGFAALISAAFFSRRHFLISVSRAMASPTF